MQVAVVGNVELDGGARAIAVQHVVDTALGIDDERYLHHHQLELLAQVVLDVAFQVENGVLRLSRTEQGVVILGKDLLQLVVIANTRSGQVGFFVENSRHDLPFMDAAKARGRMRAAMRHPNAAIDG